MARIVVFNSVTLDGVMQAPGRPDEDTRGGFALGGWALPYADPAMAQEVGERAFATTGGILLGRRTYEDFHGFWPHQGDNPFTRVLDAQQKYVVSATLAEPLPWVNSTLLSGDGVAAVRALKERIDKDLVVLGSGALIRSLLPHGLIDEWVLQVHPLVLGSGQRLFGDGTPVALELVDARVGPTGVVFATYRPATTR